MPVPVPADGARCAVVRLRLHLLAQPNCPAVCGRIVASLCEEYYISGVDDDAAAAAGAVAVDNIIKR